VPHEFTDEITCPYCDHQLEDASDHDGAMSEGETRIECPSCEREFASTCHLSWSFSTHEVDPEAERRERQERRAADEARRAVAVEEAARWTPGTRVRVRTDIGYADFLEGREGVVPNRELSRTGVVHVVLHPTDEHGRHETSLRPRHLERLG